MFRSFLSSGAKYGILNIYGPGGIGKSSVCGMFENIVKRKNIVFARIDAEDLRDWSYERILYEIAEGVTTSDPIGLYTEALKDFKREYKEYLKVRDVIECRGGVDMMFDSMAGAKDPVMVILGSVGKGLSNQAKALFKNKFTLNEYLNRTGKALTETLAAGLTDGFRDTERPVVIFIDTYERLEGISGLDHYIRRLLAPTLPDTAKLVMLGRNRLSRVSRNWFEFGKTIFEHSLPELSEQEAKSYLRQSGLNNEDVLQEVYQFTGGFPLILFDTVSVVLERGGWRQIGTFGEADRERVASMLLDRMVREDAVREMREFLEKGPALDWFNHELVAHILNIPQEKADKIYASLSKHSFIEYHNRGLCFQERIGSILRERLKHVRPELYHELRDGVFNFIQEKASLSLPPSA